MAGQAAAALGGIGDGVEKLRLLLAADEPAQPLHRAADDHQKIVEIVRDAAGQLADRFEALRLAQRILRHFAALGFVMQPLGALERDPQHGEDEHCRGQAEHQIRADR